VQRRYYARGYKAVGAPNVDHFEFVDHLGSVREVYDANRVLVARYGYGLWGERTPEHVAPGTSEPDDGYTGHLHHAPSGLALAPFRAYHPALGRWMSRDPIGEMGGINLYGYVSNNPINYYDPYGESAAAVVGAWIGGDVAIPEPTDAAWPKWVGYGLVFGGAVALDWLMNENQGDDANEAVDGGGKACPAGELKPTGETREEPATGRKARDGGKAVEEGFVDSAGRPVTRQTVYDKGGKPVHGPHYRPGGFKIPPPAP
jgi:RHS repeat-associated protein